MDKNTLNLPDRKNYAPIKPLADLRDSHDASVHKAIGAHELTKRFKEKYEELIGLNKSAWRSMVAAGQINGLFIQGEQILKINQYTGMPRIDKTNAKDPLQLKVVNKLQQYCTQMQAKWRSSKPDIVLQAISGEDAAIAQARKANAVCDHLERQFFKTWFDLQEGLHAQIWGWYGREVYADTTSRSLKTFRDILGEKEVPIGKASGRCDKCGYRGDDAREMPVGATTMNACPKCESLEYEFEPAVTAFVKQVVGREQVFLPEIVCRPLDFAATRWDLSKKLEESSWAIMEREVSEGEIRQILGDIKLPEGESGNDFGLQALDLIAKRGAAMDGENQTNRVKKTGVTLTRMFLSPADLYDIWIGTDEETVEGGALPKGKRGSDVFKEGCTVIGINGLALILGLYHGTHCDSVASGVFHMKPNSGTGRGIDDTIPIQRQFNRRHTQIDNHLANRATPPILTPEGAIEPRFRRMLGTPGAVIPVKLQNFPQVRDIGQIVRGLQGESVPGDLVHITYDRLESMLQMAYHIMNFAGGNPRADNRTATGAEILDANADEIVTPMLTVKAECNLETVRKAFYKWVAVTPEARFVRFKDPKKAGTFGIAISGPEVDAEYEWSYVPGSEAPKTRFTENQKRLSFFNMFGGVAGYLEAKKMFPAEVRELERDFDVNFQTEDYDSVAESCRLRLTRGREVLMAQAEQSNAFATQGIAMPPDYGAILAQIHPAPLPTEARLPEKILWFQNFLDSEEGLAAAPEERELVSAFILAFEELAKIQASKIQRDAAEVQMAAQAPQMQAQAAQQMAQQEQQAAIAQQQAQQQQEAEAPGQAMQVLQTLGANAESEANRESADRNAEADRQIRMLEMQHEKELADRESDTATYSQ